MIRNIRYRLDASESMRRIRQRLGTGGGGSFGYRRVFGVFFCIAFVLLYLGPLLMRWMFSSPEPVKDHMMRCIDDRLTPFYPKSLQFNANIRHSNEEDAKIFASSATDRNHFIPYVGNGWFGIEIQQDASMMIKSGRNLALPVYFHPIVSVSHKAAADQRAATVVDYLSGIVHRYQCFDEGYFVSYEYYAHRVHPAVFVQELKITNTKNQLVDIDLTASRISDWPSAIKQTIKLEHGSTGAMEYQVVTGMVETHNRHDDVLAVSIVSRKTPRSVTLKKRGVTNLEYLLAVNYSRPIAREDYARKKDEVQAGAVQAMQRALLDAEHPNNSGGSSDTNKMHQFKRRHTQIWKSLWSTGFEISSSLAEDSINGDRINATMYAVLSHTRMYEQEVAVSPETMQQVQRAMANVEGCYDSYHTLQAENLWKDMRTVEELNTLVSSWMLTLEKQGCHNLLKAGASGAMQAMVLSLGGFRFSNQHLELNIHPKYLHRDYLYRRLNYGNVTHINVSVSVTEDNKAVLYVAVDRSIGQYYACDAGCLDDPVRLGPERKQFPVKLTDPLTAILYIASDREHIEELRHAIHVKELAEAPAHEHHVIALHKHGHHLGGLPTLFWISICVIIVVFHVFLCKLVVKEYCEPPDKMRYRYSKP